jgi:lipopolysaccharide export system permease protein
MIFTQIWERYFFKEIIKIFFFFLFCFYGLYVLIDYASHTSALPHHSSQIKWQELTRYYLFIFASRAEILIPLALLIATIKTLCSLNHSHEWVALMAGGFKTHTLLRPFLLVGLTGAMLIYINEQYLLPPALKKLRFIEDANKHQSHRNKLSLAARHLLLEDGSVLLFQSYDTAQERFFDAYWIQSADQIYRIKYLYPYLSVVTGRYVDHLERELNGELTLKESHAELSLPQIRFNSK